jgi:hypothetical protein
MKPVPKEQPLPAIRIGQKIKVKSLIRKGCDSTGAINYINYSYRWFNVRHDIGGWNEMIWMDSNDYSIERR